ncbi:TldD/PmbA family protein [Actinoplanes xinjiangensis]|uniref:Putative Zn-dependent protease n=1 Tax=Actinoplanes xinjiangensis TaxID=512350 RepID=A0A316FQT8_9ACTN|nr:metallopeptidase TldD-related protein [Actinoplanes xinjiangensis]PWK50673.1 putative Zn-dependent protease [Actinoplanes xinjiangensis]GIF36563.1 peptidase U62 [Actinoplanes xinjiangensis]
MSEGGRAGAELELAARVIELVRELAGREAEAEVNVRHDAEALTRFANSTIHQNVASATTGVRLRLHAAGRTAGGSTTVTSADGLRTLVERTLAAVRVSPVDRSWPGLAPPAALRLSAGHPGSGERSGLAFGFDEATARADPAERAERVGAFVRAAGGLETAGYCRTVYVSAAFANSAGQAVEGRTAEAAMDGIARCDGADGVARLAAARLADLDGAVLGARAAAKARAARGPVELPPGHYEVVLEPDAVRDLLENFAVFGFDGKAHHQQQSFADLGTAQFDPSVTIVDEPLGSREEPAADLPFDDEGTPRRPLVLVREGVTAAVTHDRTSAALAGTASTGHASPVSRSWGPKATHLRLEAAPVPGAAPGTGGTGSIADSARPLVAGMRRGLLITDLWYTRVLDPKALVITGLTRNGVWLVEDGEITSAVSNVRFTQSYPRALGPGRVLGIGAETVLLPESWGRARYAAPALHLAEWNVTGNASG